MVRAHDPAKATFDDIIERSLRQMIDDGRQIFRYDTFGDEAFWGDALRLHQAIAGEAHGGVGPGVSPRTALAVGLKVDVGRAAAPRSSTRPQARARSISTIRRRRWRCCGSNAVVGVTGFFDARASSSSMGIQCALCHSTVDDSFAPGIGRRLDGWANRDLDVGAIIALAPDLQPFAELLGVDEATVRAVLDSWGPGKFDAELILDGKAFRPDGKPAATLIPPAFGLAGVNLHTWTGWGSRHALERVRRQPRDARPGHVLRSAAGRRRASSRSRRASGFGNMRNDAGSHHAKLAALHFYQLATPRPDAAAGSFDAAAATRGKTLFDGQGAVRDLPRAAALHRARLEHAHAPRRSASTTSRPSARRTGATARRRCAGLWTHTKGGFYHDGRFATLRRRRRPLRRLLRPRAHRAGEGDLVEYLKSL